MPRLLIATDFSTRSDRALRRACLLAKSLPAALALVHVIDPDRPAALVEAERRAAETLLAGMQRGLREVDGIDCDVRLVEGEPFEGIASAVSDSGADLVVIGPHRRQLLRDVFVGTTAERTVRTSRRPVLMCNAVPVEPYRRIAVAVDLSAVSAAALRSVYALGLDRGAAVSVLHVFDALAADLGLRSPGLPVAGAEMVEQARQQAQQDVVHFLQRHGLPSLPIELYRNDGAAGAVIQAAAERCGADLLVLGTRGQRQLAVQMLGSVAEAVMRVARIDVLAVPPGDTGA
ncbi:universal stress protein [Fontimonas sp. SYSU GA230001]|uniref:universal stress protein n=1 Tax=Fontimonas sp. SYSU GA230001 TaxID=3142450 RepID=UPI0032B4B220